MISVGNSVTPTEFVIKNLKDEKRLNQQIKDFIKDYNAPYTYEWIVSIEKYLNDKLEDSRVKFLEETEKNGEVVDRSELPAYEGYGNKAENRIYRLLKKAAKEKILDITDIKEQNPNGEMKFPDYNINGIYVDSKAVKCVELKNGEYSAHYSNSLADKSEIITMVDHFINTNSLTEKTSALIIYTYYIPDGMYIKTLKIKVVPYLFCVATKKENKGFIVKWETPDGEIKNNAVCNKLKILYSYSDYLNNLKEALEYEKSKCISRPVSTVS